MTGATPMTKVEAREAMDAVIDAIEDGLTRFARALEIVKDVEARGGYKALGHRSMAACLAQELQVSRARAYQILDEMRASSLLSEAVGEQVVVGAREASQVVRAAPEKVQAVAERVRAGEPPRTAVRAELPVTRSPIRDGGAAAFDFDEGEAILECPHCHRVAPQGRYIVKREAVEAFG